MDSFGHLNNAVYFTFFEQVRIAYMRALEMLSGHGPGELNFILLETQCRFLKPCFLGDELTAQASIVRLGDSSCEMAYRLVRGQEPVAEGKGVLVYFDYHAGKKVSIPAELRERIARIEGWEKA